MPVDMCGSFELTSKDIDRQISFVTPGNYVLGSRYQKNDKFYFEVCYVGRADQDLNKKLKKHIGHYDRFMYSTAATAEEAFIKQCRNYHDFMDKLDNIFHPVKPFTANWQCTFCDRMPVLIFMASWLEKTMINKPNNSLVK